jgi:hypothetical protein
VWPGEVPVWCSGRWGRRRVRVNECWLTVRAEDLYSQMLGHNRIAPGARGATVFSLEGRELSVGWEVRQNAVWRSGRVFLVCPRCSRRCTRAYVPTETARLACRRCWGLTYESRALNYKDTPWRRGYLARAFGTTQREWALMTTAEWRQERREASRRRWKERRRYLK